MSIPDYQSLMLPLLTLAADGNEHRFRNAVEQLAARFELSDDERATMLPKYYAARGWDPEGRPTAATKERLGL